MVPAPVAKLAAELFGTFWLVFGGCGSAIFAAKQVAELKDTNDLPFGVNVGIGYLGRPRFWSDGGDDGLRRLATSPAVTSIRR